MTFGVVLTGDGAEHFLDRAIEQARQAAEAGIASGWLAQRFDYDAVALAGLLGREVPGLQVGTSAVPIFGRHPVLVAGQALTAQAASGNRLHLGLALGAKQLVESTFGLPYQRPAAVLREFLTALRTLLDTGTADFHGEFVTAAPAPVLLVALPGAKPPPVLVAAMGPQALKVTGELADGTLPYLAGPRALGEHIVPALTRAAEAAGRPAPRVVALVPAVVTEDVAGVREAAIERLSFYEQVPSYLRVLELEGVKRAGEVALVGDEETVAAGIQRHLDAGATEVILSETGLAGEEARLRTWRLLGELNRERAGRQDAPQGGGAEG